MNIKKWAKGLFESMRNWQCMMRTPYRGDYADWDSALQDSGGYAQDAIIQKVTESALKVKNGEAVFERDSVVFDKIEYSWPVLAGLMRAAAMNKGCLHVLDFGGALGTHYFQNKKLLCGLKKISWSVVEQDRFVQIGREHFQEDNLCFYSSIEDCLKQRDVNVALFSSVLQYLKEPYSIVESICNRGIPHIILDRFSVVDRERDHISVQTVPDHIYKAKYPCRFFSPNKLMNIFWKNIAWWNLLIARFPIEHMSMANIWHGTRDIFLSCHCEQLLYSF